jgi:hypothetical protein
VRYGLDFFRRIVVFKGLIKSLEIMGTHSNRSSKDMQLQSSLFLMYNVNEIEIARNLYVIFGFMKINNESLELGK